MDTHFNSNTAMAAMLTTAEEALFSAEVVLPEQFYQLTKGNPETTGPRALMAAILEDAILCFQKAVGASGKRSERLARDAEEWLMSEEEQWPFSYRNICAVLGIDAQYLRRGLLQWRQRREQRLAAKRVQPVAVSTPLQQAA